MFYSLIRTVPCINGNITLSCKLNNNTKIDKYTYISNVQSANLWPLDEKPIMEADSMYNINLKFNSLEFDIPKIYQYLNNNDLFYKEYNVSDFKVSDERNKLNEFGCRRISYKKHDNFQFMFFAPIYCDNFEDLPNIFLLKIRFFNDKDEEILVKNIHININKETKTNYLYLYLKNYLNKLDDNMMYIAPKADGSVEYIYKLFGIDLINGGFSTNEYIKTHTYIENPLNYDKSICYQWKDKKIVVKQIIPLSFVFNIDDFLSNYEKLYLRNMPFKISGSYINSNSKVFDLYDFDSDYTPNYCQELLKYNYNDLVIDTKSLKYYNKEYLSDPTGNMKNYNKEDLQKWIFENNYLDNKLSTQYFKWKLKLSSNDSPYIINENEIYTEQLGDKGIQHIASTNFANELLISNLGYINKVNYNLYLPNFNQISKANQSLSSAATDIYYKYYDYNILYLLNILGQKKIPINKYGYSQLRYIINNTFLKKYIENQKNSDSNQLNISYDINELADELFIKKSSNNGEIYYELNSDKIKSLSINFNLINIDYVLGDDTISYNKIIDTINNVFIDNIYKIINDFLNYQYYIEFIYLSNKYKSEGKYREYDPKSNSLVTQIIYPTNTITQTISQTQQVTQTIPYTIVYPKKECWTKCRETIKTINLITEDNFINIFINIFDSNIDIQKTLNKLLIIIQDKNLDIFNSPDITEDLFINQLDDDECKNQINEIFRYSRSTLNNDINIINRINDTTNKLNNMYINLYSYYYLQIYYILKKYQEYLHILLKSKISKSLYSKIIYQFNINKIILNELSIYYEIIKNKIIKDNSIDKSKIKETRINHINSKLNKLEIKNISLCQAFILLVLYFSYNKNTNIFNIDEHILYQKDRYFINKELLNYIYLFNWNTNNQSIDLNIINMINRYDQKELKYIFKNLSQNNLSIFISNNIKSYNTSLNDIQIKEITNKTIYYFFKYKKLYNQLLNKKLYNSKLKYSDKKLSYNTKMYKNIIQLVINSSIYKTQKSIIKMIYSSYQQNIKIIEKFKSYKNVLNPIV